MVVKKHVAKSGSNAGKWVVCQAQHNCRNGGTHVNASTLKEAKQFIKKNYNLVIPIPDIDPRMLEAYVEHRKQSKPPVQSAAASFKPVTAPREAFVEGSSEHDEHVARCRAFLHRVAEPGFDLEEWRQQQELSEKEYAENDPFADLGSLGERASIEFYSEQGYSEIRSHLSPVILFGSRAGQPKQPLSPAHEARMNHVVKQIDSALQKAETARASQLVYRGFHVPRFVEDHEVERWLEKKFPVGGKFSQTNYLSTTVDPMKAVKFSHPGDLDEKRSVIFEIISKKGAAIGEGISQFTHESEVLLPRDTEFRIVEVVKNSPFEVVGATGTIFKENRTIVRLVDVP